MIMTDAVREATVSAPAQRLTVLSRARPYRGHSGWAILNPKTSPPPCAKLKLIDLARARNEVHCFFELRRGRLSSDKRRRFIARRQRRFVRMGEGIRKQRG